jgi:hypothetical protein
MAGAEALGAKALGMKQYLLKLRVLRALARLRLSRSAQTQMPLSQAFQEQGQSGQSQSSKGRVLTYLSRAWRALDLSERLLYPLMRMLAVTGNAGTGAVGSLTVTGTANVSVTGVQGNWPNR